MKKIILALIVPIVVAILTVSCNHTPVSKPKALYCKPWVMVMNDQPCVDLGLPSGNLWAMCNIGAVSPIDKGDYFAWGETQPKPVYSWDTYFDTEDGGVTFQKYKSSKCWKFSDCKSTTYDHFRLEDDAANVYWGGNWAVPNIDDYFELCQNCCLLYTNDYYGTTGWIVYKAKQKEDKGKRYNKNSSKLPLKEYDYKEDPHIFIPCVGYMCGDSTLNWGFSSYMTNSLWYHDLDSRTCLTVSGEPMGLIQYISPRYIGQPVRAVWYKKNPAYL